MPFALLTVPGQKHFNGGSLGMKEVQSVQERPQRVRTCVDFHLSCKSHVHPTTVNVSFCVHTTVGSTSDVIYPHVGWREVEIEMK